jgi:hypothetical protein
VSVVVVVPSRGRPEACVEAVRAIRKTAAIIATSVVVAVDNDDSCLSEYQRQMQEFLGGPYLPEVSLVGLQPEETGSLIRATNTVSRRIAADDPNAIIGNLNDDHRCRTVGWDRAIIEALEKPGIAYGNDLIHGERLPSAPFVSARIVNALGWYFLPTAEHMYGDDALRILGQALGSIHYLPDVIVEHMHPAVKKGKWDEGYDRAYASVESDKAAFNEWHQRYLKLDVMNVQRALGVI